MALSNDVIKAMRPGETVGDNSSPASVVGLQVRCTEKNRKCFLLFYRTKNGIQRRPKIGEWPEITIGEARRRAQAIKDRVAVGDDPGGEWAESRKELTIAEMYEKTKAEHWDTPRFKESERLVQVMDLWRNNLRAEFGDKKLSQVKPPTIAKWLARYVDKPSVGNRSLEVLSKIFTYAEQLGIRPPGSNPCSAVPAFPERKRNRYATTEELKALIPILEREFNSHPSAVAFLYLLMFTGSRPKALEDAKWEQLQTFEKDGKVHGILTFKGKTSETTGEDEVVVLPPLAMDVLAKLPRLHGRTILNCKMPSRFWQKVRKEAGCEDLWARDFRRTFASVGLSSGVNVGTIGELLNHKSTQTTKTYAKLATDSRVSAATAISQQMERLFDLG